MYVLLVVWGGCLYTELTVVIWSIPALLELGNWVNCVPMLWDGQLENWILIPGVDPPQHCIRAALGSTHTLLRAEVAGAWFSDSPHIMPKVEKD
jgi:hypothetical protein